MNSKLFVIMSLLVFGFTLNGHAQTSAEPTSSLKAPSVKVQKLITKFNLEVVDYDYAKKSRW